MDSALAARALLIPALLLLGLATQPVAAQSDAEVDYLQLAARLVADGNYDRAERALSQVKTEADDLDRVRYHTLLGLVDLRREDHEGAIQDLQQALDAHEKRARKNPDAEKDQKQQRRSERERIHLYLAQAHMGLEQYKQALGALDRSGETGAAIAMVHALRAQAHWQREEYDAAFAALNRGARRFPDDYQFLRRKVFYLINLGFYRQAADSGREYLQKADAGPRDYVAIGTALRQSDQHQAALTLLERARLIWPQDRDIAVELAHTWLGMDKVAAAAEVFARASVYHPAMRLEAAELQRRAGRLYRALMLNTTVPDPEKKYRQRLAILVAMEHWDQAAGMGDALRRHGLLDNDDLRYAFAYALFKAGDYDRADQVLSGIQDSDTFRKATELRKAMEQCREAEWQCL